jgi:hypothetical protein
LRRLKESLELLHNVTQVPTHTQPSPCTSNLRRAASNNDRRPIPAHAMKAVFKAPKVGAISGMCTHVSDFHAERSKYSTIVVPGRQCHSIAGCHDSGHQHHERYCSYRPGEGILGTITNILTIVQAFCIACTHLSCIVNDQEQSDFLTIDL